MSYFKLHSFLKENGHDVMDYWCCDSLIHHVRVVSRMNGNIYFIDVSGQEIAVPPLDGDPYKKSTFYFMERCESGNNLHSLHESLSTVFPEYRHKFILFHGYYLLQDKDNCFHVQNMSDRDYLGLYLILELEWFYENVYIVSHEMEKSYINLQEKIEKMYHGFLPHYQSFSNDLDQQRIHNIWETYQSNSHCFQKSRRLYSQIVQTENTTMHDIEYNEKIIDSDDLMIQETIRRNYNKKKLDDKLEKIGHLKKKVIDKVLLYYRIQWSILLKYIQIVSRFTKLRSDFTQLVYDFESILPRSRVFIDERTSRSQG